MSNKTVRCAIYTRKSTDEGLDQAFNSLDAQRLSGESYVSSQQHEGWVILPTHYDDGGYSGGNLERPALQALFKDIEAGLIDTVVVYKIDRLSRSLLDFAKIVDMFERYNVTFVAVTQAFNTANSMGRLMLNVLLSFAQFEREVGRERTLDKIRSSKQKGLWMGGNIPLGYDIKDRQLIINPEEGPLVQQIFKRFVDLKSPVLLCRELNQKGHHTKKWVSTAGIERGGNPFTRGTLQYLLTNPIYKGMVPHKGNLYPGQHEGIIDEKLWGQVQAIFKICPQERKHKNSNALPCLLRNLIRCQACNTPMTPTYTVKNGQKKYRYYVCNHHMRGKSCVGTHHTIAAAEVERFVVQQIRAQLRHPEILGDALEGLNQQSMAQDEAMTTLQGIDQIWDTLFPIEQQRICQQVVDAVWFSDQGIKVDIRTDGLQLLLNQAGMEAVQ